MSTTTTNASKLNKADLLKLVEEYQQAEVERMEKERLAAAERTSGKAKEMKHWAIGGVAVMSILSAGLNGYANAQHSPIGWAGWAMGFTIPIIILVLGKVAGLAWKRQQKPLAYCTAAAGVGLLALSVWHCASSIALLTGSHILLALPMAVAIDVGFVCCEYAAMQD